MAVQNKLLLQLVATGVDDNVGPQRAVRDLDARPRQVCDDRGRRSDGLHHVQTGPRNTVLPGTGKCPSTPTACTTSTAVLCAASVNNVPGHVKVDFHLAIDKEYRLSRRSSAPRPAASVASYSARISALYCAVNDRRFGRSERGVIDPLSRDGDRTSALVRVILVKPVSPCAGRELSLPEVSRASLTHRETRKRRSQPVLRPTSSARLSSRSTSW